MKPTQLSFPAIAALLSCLTSSCVTHITYKDEPRQHIGFSSALAAQVFYEALFLPDRPKRNGAVTVGLPLPYGHRTISTEYTRFNEAVRTADRNGDKVISESEARAFAAKESADNKPQPAGTYPGKPAAFTEL